MKKIRIVVLAGGPSSEHEVSLNSARLVMQNLNPKTYQATLVIIERNGKWRFPGDKKPIPLGAALERLASENFDLAFIAMHGAFGEDGRIQALLEWVELPYVGSGILSSAMAIDKDVANILYKAYGLRVPRYVTLNKHSKIAEQPPIPFPFIVKPIGAGSSVGVSIVKNAKEFRKACMAAFKEDDRIMLQEYIKGRELTCGVLEGGDGMPFALPPTEIIPKAAAFFDYRAKYKVGGSSEITPAALEKSQTKELQALALKAHKLLGCRGMSRSDFMLKGSTFYILETNTIPGMTKTSLLPQGAKAGGFEFPEFLDLLINGALRRVERRRTGRRGV